ncbi:MAG: hypothetical protein LBH19_11565, partial [Dysgonamonadaceae bacterium]|nr:hypothetical protein [Dysgonamonadaceae bacterium]
MTRNSKKQVLVLLFGLLLSGSIYSQIETLYIYGTDNSQQEIAIGDVQKLTFSGSTLVVNKTDETTVVAGFDGLRLFNLVDNASSLYTWTGNSDNMWTKPENWRSYYVPQSFQNAMIPAVN